MLHGWLWLIIMRTLNSQSVKTFRNPIILFSNQSACIFISVTDVIMYGVFCLILMILKETIPFYNSPFVAAPTSCLLYILHTFANTSRQISDIHHLIRFLRLLITLPILQHLYLLLLFSVRTTKIVTDCTEVYGSINANLIIPGA